MPPPTTTQATIDGVRCTLEKLPDGCIRVTHESQQLNAMQGRATAGEVMYLVHPAQRNQYEFINGLLPTEQRGGPEGEGADAKPWWSYTGAAKQKREKGDGE